MARRGQHVAAPIPGDPEDTDSWCAIVEQYLLSLELRDLSPHTVYGRRRALARLAQWALDESITTPIDVDDHTVHTYRLRLHRHVTTAGTPLSTRTKQQYLIAIRGLYRWLHSNGHTAHDPTSAIELPSTPLQLPRNYLTAQQAEHVLTIPDLTTPLGRRNRTMLEILYATGIRSVSMRKVVSSRRSVTGGSRPRADRAPRRGRVPSEHRGGSGEAGPWRRSRDPA